VIKELGDEAEVKAKGKVQTVGKNYVMSDGEIPFRTWILNRKHVSDTQQATSYYSRPAPLKPNQAIRRNFQLVVKLVRSSSGKEGCFRGYVWNNYQPFVLRAT
jgi:hypothetical protein